LPVVGPGFADLLEDLRHEFFTPLTVIEGYTSTLLSHREHLIVDEQDEFLREIRHAGRRLEKLTTQVLDMARLEAGMLDLSFRPIDLTALAGELLAQAQEQVSAPLRDRFTFSLSHRDARGTPALEPAMIVGDERRVRQVLQHLLENAIAYSPEGGRIDVIVRPALGVARGVDGEIGADSRNGSEETFFETCVCDGGVGIPEEHLERVFDPFYRLDTGLTRERYGLGLGLSACRQIATLHGGRLWAESCPAGGSAFHLWLPSAGPETA
jgi:signal transduction histidine kinase